MTKRRTVAKEPAPAGDRPRETTAEPVEGGSYVDGKLVHRTAPPPPPQAKET